MNLAPAPAVTLMISIYASRWNLIGILAHPATRGLDFYCRLDTHSNILSNVSDDMFGHMAAHGVHYGFVARRAPRFPPQHHGYPPAGPGTRPERTGDESLTSDVTLIVPYGLVWDTSS